MSRPKKFGELVRERRKAKGISIRELSRRVGMSNAYLSQLETGANDNPSAKLKFSIEEELGITKTDVTKAITLESYTTEELLDELKLRGKVVRATGYTIN